MNLPSVARTGARAGWLPIALAVGVLAWVTIGRILGKTGHPGAPLDDSYIHFQYARALAEGHPFQFHDGEPPTSGATSLAWPALLAPFWLVGFRDEAILWPAWGVAFAALGGLSWEAWALTRKLAGDAAAIGAAAMVIAFPAFAWFAASGMEVIPFAWLLARSARRASEWAEAPPEERTRARGRELILLAWGVVFMRPEGALACLALAVVLGCHPRAPTLASRLFALAALAPMAVQPLVLLLFTGSARSTTANVKLLAGNPYQVGHVLTESITANVKLLVGTLLDGKVYSAEFLPSGGAWFAFAGLASVAVLGWRTGRMWRAALVIALALSIVAPCGYVTFLWNRLRYLWPFAPGWLVGLACLARLVGDAAGWWSPRARVATPILCGAIVGMLLMRMDWTVEDVAQSVSGIDRQQVTLGRWAKTALPETARVGVNDTGAIAYFGERTTFDVVGLTTRSEGRYWVAGVGSRLEHYERLHARDPARLPTHFIVYPGWFVLPTLLGAPLQEATVTDSTILGGQTMRAYVADYSLLGSGEAPWTALGTVVDALDVADLESEADHRYLLLGAHDNEETAGLGVSPDGREVIDGGRSNRVQERFVARLTPGVATQGVVRVQSEVPTKVVVRAGGKDVGLFEIDPGSWVEASFGIPAAQAASETPIDVIAVDGGTLTFFHYWFAPALGSAMAPL